MILDPDAYFDDALAKQKLRQQAKYSRHMPNLHKLNIERLLVPIVLNIQLKQDLILRDRFDWDLADDHKSPYNFAKNFAVRLNLTPEVEASISNQILEQIIDHIDQYTVQTRTRIPRNIEEQAANNLTCLQCGSILYNNDFCRACGISLEKLRQKYGHLTSALNQENHTNEDDSTPLRQTERQRTLESTRRRNEPALSGSRKSCARCGEPNHYLSIECRQCNKPLIKSFKKPNTAQKALAYHFWRILNKDSQFYLLVMLNDTLKDNDFRSVNALYEKLKQLIAECENPPASASSYKIYQMLEFTENCYSQILSSPIPDDILHIQQSNQGKIEIKELDANCIHSSTPVSDQYNTYMAARDYNKKVQRQEFPGRRRGRPRKNPLSEQDAQLQADMQDDTIEARRKLPNDASMNECGVCAEPGDLICCEVCPSVYHLDCLNLQQVPRGKWFCFFCRVVKDGLYQALSQYSQLSRAMAKLVKKVEGWRLQALQIISILLLNPCSRELAPEQPSMVHPPEDITSIKVFLEEGRYQSLEEVDSDLRYVFKVTSKLYKKKNASIYSAIFNIQLFHNKMLFELENFAGIQINTQPINMQNRGDQVSKRMKYSQFIISKMRAKRGLMKKKMLRLASDSENEDENNPNNQSASCEIGQEGLNFVKENFKVGRQGEYLDDNGQIAFLDPNDLQIGKVLGRGASGVVMEAYHVPSGSIMAIKSFNAYDKDKRHQLIKDIRAVQFAKCHFLVKFYGAWFKDGQVKIALEFMNAGSLGDLVKKQPKPIVPEPVLSKITQQILNGLMYLHKVKHQVHRDIKPDNILINTQGAVKLSDFGISKDLGVTMGLCSTFVGTMIYMSPERIHGKKYSYSSDIWSLGMMLLELSQGSFPYPKVNTYIEMMDNIMNMPLPQPTPNYSSDFADFIMKCISREPKERCSTIQLAAHPWVLRYSQQEADIPSWVAQCLSKN